MTHDQHSRLVRRLEQRIKKKRSQMLEASTLAAKLVIATEMDELKARVRQLKMNFYDLVTE